MSGAASPAAGREGQSRPARASGTFGPARIGQRQVDSRYGCDPPAAAGPRVTGSCWEAAAMKTIDDLEVAGRRVLVRADLNVPLDGARITDDARIRASLPTLSALRARGAKIVLCAHLGRPVPLAVDTVGPAARQAVAALRPGGIVVLQNLRFSAAETSKDDAERGAFADRLAGLADLPRGHRAAGASRPPGPRSGASLSA